MSDSFLVSVSSEEPFKIYSVCDGPVNYPLYGYFQDNISPCCTVQSHTPILYAASVLSAILSSLLSYLPLLYNASSSEDKFSFYIFTH